MAECKASKEPKLRHRGSSIGANLAGGLAKKAGRRISDLAANGLASLKGGTKPKVGPSVEPPAAAGFFSGMTTSSHEDDAERYRKFNSGWRAKVSGFLESTPWQVFVALKYVLTS